MRGQITRPRGDCSLGAGMGADPPTAAWPPKALLVGLHVDRRGGLEGYTVDLGNALQRLGWEVEAISVLTQEQGTLDGLPTQGLMPEWIPESLFALIWQRALDSHLKRRRRHPDVVIAAHPYTLALVGRYARRVGVPYVGIFHGLEARADWSHAFVMPSAVEKRADGTWTGEGFGIVYIEAAACGLPVVALEQGGAREAVAQGETGLLVERTEVAVGAAVLRLLGDRSLGRRMGMAGRARVCRDFSAEAFDRRLSEFMERAIPRAIPEPA